MQIDSVEFRKLQAGGKPSEEPPQEDADGPVFVDESGRRSKKFRRIGWVLALACAGYAVTLVVALIGGNSNAPSLLIPGQTEDKADTAEETPGPSETPTAPAGTEVEVVAGVPSPSGSTAAVRREPTVSVGEPADDRSSSPAGDSATGTATPAAGGGDGATTAPEATESTDPGGTGDNGGTAGGEQTADPTDPVPTETSTEEPPGEPAAQGGQLAGEGAR
ncbi:hypothetical protein SCWH03_00520 [Streptomyces pacificus]|uniref:Uncharacterized protein n=2 Tax=Streptomyces pacificus TaxID=2705029 RepID=A0A6A0AM51_9ACTN|nr:hypothetical protein SCWH03_00520 [Streptomyces pacificus]